MYAQIKDGAIEATGTLKQLFPNTSFPAGVADNDFKTANNLQDIVLGEKKDLKYYFVTLKTLTAISCMCKSLIQMKAMTEKWLILARS